MPSRENTSPEFSAGELFPGLNAAGIRRVVGAAECGDRTVDMMPWIDRIPVREGKIGSQRRQQRGDELRVLHDCRRGAAKSVQNGEKFMVGSRMWRERGRGRNVGAAATGSEQMHGRPAVQ